MEVLLSEKFRKVYEKGIKYNVISETAFHKALKLFIAQPFEPKLKTHKLSGDLKGLWSFSVAYDIRIVFYFTEEKPHKAIFVDIGNHDEVY